MKFDCSKISNKDDLIIILSLLFLITQISFVLYLAFSVNSFWAGFVSATVVWKWKSWFYDPVDAFLERKWPRE